MLSIETELTRVKQQHNLIGMSVLALVDNEIVYSGSFGLSNILSNKKVSSNTLYRMASISKMIDATAFMILLEQGKCSLNDDIGIILGFDIKNPNFREVKITPAMLLSHTSGICDNAGYDAFLTDSYNFNQPPLLENLLTASGNYYFSDMWGIEKPGTFFRYSNLNYGILAALIEKVSGDRFDVFCRKHIFEPLQMDASFNVNDIPNYDDIATLYGNTDSCFSAQLDDYSSAQLIQKDYSSYIPGSNGMMFGPQGGMRVSLNDLVKFMMLHINNGNFNGAEILKKETAELMTQAIWRYDGNNGDNYGNQFLCWGLGFQILTDAHGCDKYFRNLSMIGHPGDGYGLLSCMYFNKEKKTGVIFATNGSKSQYEPGVNTAFYKVVEDVLAIVDNAFFVK